jgi:hypothetical protein
MNIIEWARQLATPKSAVRTDHRQERLTRWMAAWSEFLQHSGCFIQGKLVWSSGIFTVDGVPQKYNARMFGVQSESGMHPVVYCQYEKKHDKQGKLIDTCFRYVGHEQCTTAQYNAVKSRMNTWCHMGASRFTMQACGISLNVLGGREVDCNETVAGLESGAFNNSEYQFTQLAKWDANDAAGNGFIVVAGAAHLGRSSTGHVAIVEPHHLTPWAPGLTVTNAGIANRTRPAVPIEDAFGGGNMTKLKYWVLERKS